MQAIWSIAATTFRESIRNRTILAIFLLALGFVASALVLAAMSLDQRVRVIKDWGMFCVSAFGVLLAILMGVNLVQKEVMRKTLYVMLSRPIQRWKYVAGKYLGLALVLLLEVGALSAALVMVLATENEQSAVDQLMYKALYITLVEVLLVAGFAVFFSSFASPYLSGFFTLGLFVVGRSLPALSELAERVDIGIIKWILNGLFFGLPNLSDFVLSSKAINQIEIPTIDIAWLSVYATGYLLMVLVLSAIIFSKRDLA